ncbi:protein NLP1-like [Iris pallida]|uniref:Protein NLP1-like n=1 Tax=Iris pallida TaxID=29817 RepID=A0AAX6DWX0_IRIPA|nr:protein NLP1-like [Iris pallida]KAJ6829653.1 protein NLP1-like [Iris pallida]
MVGQRIFRLDERSYVRRETRLVRRECSTDQTLAFEQVMFGTRLVEAEHGSIVYETGGVDSGDAVPLVLLGVATASFALLDARDPSLSQRQTVGLANNSQDTENLRQCRVVRMVTLLR